jgi:hypothetical protein
MTENWSNETEAPTLATFASQHSIFDPSSGETRTASFRKRLSVTLITFDSDAESYVILSAVLVAQPASGAAQNAAPGNVFITLTIAIFSPLLWHQSFCHAFDFITSEPIQMFVA